MASIHMCCLLYVILFIPHWSVAPESRSGRNEVNEAIEDGTSAKMVNDDTARAAPLKAKRIPRAIGSLGSITRSLGYGKQRVYQSSSQTSRRTYGKRKYCGYRYWCRYNRRLARKRKRRSAGRKRNKRHLRRKGSSKRRMATLAAS